MRFQHVLLSNQKEAPWALLKVHYISTRALAAFKGGDICLVLVYKTTSALLFGPPVSSSVAHSIKVVTEAHKLYYHNPKVEHICLLRHLSAHCTMHTLVPY
jgi:hypothetical protein